MSSIVELLKDKSFFYCSKGATSEQIHEAERTLGLKFSDDYREYLHNYGLVSCGGHELTGISDDSTLNVVNVTLKNLEKNPNIKIPLYVLEETHMDGIVIWQAESGEIYQSPYKGAPEKIYGTLIEYVSTFEDKG